MSIEKLKGKGLLSPIQRKALSLFSSLADQEKFYLTGGTALSEFYLGHRISYDIDLFTPEEGLILPFSYSLEKRFEKEGWEVEISKRFSTYVELLLRWEGDELRLDLSQDSPYRLEPLQPSVYGVFVNGYKDIIANKVLAYYGRWEPRDAVDLYFILKKESLERVILWAEKKDPGFDLYWFAISLQRAEDFPDEAEQWPVKVILPWSPLELKKIFLKISREIMEKI